MGRVPPSNTQSWHNQPLLTSPLISQSPSIRLIRYYYYRYSWDSFHDGLAICPSWNIRRVATAFTIYSLWFQVLRKAPGPSLSGKYHREQLVSGVLEWGNSCTVWLARTILPRLFRILPRNNEDQFVLCSRFFSPLWIITRSAVSVALSRFLHYHFFPSLSISFSLSDSLSLIELRSVEIGYNNFLVILENVWYFFYFFKTVFRAVYPPVLPFSASIKRSLCMCL